MIPTRADKRLILRGWLHSIWVEPFLYFRSGCLGSGLQMVAGLKVRLEGRRDINSSYLIVDALVESYT